MHFPIDCCHAKAFFNVFHSKKHTKYTFYTVPKQLLSDRASPMAIHCFFNGKNQNIQFMHFKRNCIATVRRLSIFSLFHSKNIRIYILRSSKATAMQQCSAYCFCMFFQSKNTQFLCFMPFERHCDATVRRLSFLCVFH